MRQVIKLISAILMVLTLSTFTLILSGCGLKGPLYYPPSSSFATIMAQLSLSDKTV